MTEVTPTVDTVPAPVVTTPPAAIVEQKSDATPATPDEQKTLTQEEVNKLVAKRLDRERRKWERERAQPPVTTTPVTPPKVEDFSDAPAYAEALAETKATEIANKREAERHAATVRAAYDEREETARDKYDDFEQVAYNPNVPVTQVMAEAVMRSKVGPEVLYHLGSNPKEAHRIAQLPLTEQAMEIGELSAKLAAAPPVKTVSTAPAPISPVTPAAVAAKTYDTTDPRAAKEMSTSDWIEAERARQRKAAEAKRNR